MHYIGMDCHISTLDFAVVNESGEVWKVQKVINVENIIT